MRGSCKHPLINPTNKEDRSQGIHNMNRSSPQPRAILQSRVSLWHKGCWARPQPVPWPKQPYIEIGESPEKGHALDQTMIVETIADDFGEW